MRIFLVFFFFLAQLLLKSQDYIPLLDNQNEWQLLYCYGEDCAKDSYYTDGDTISNGKTYKILDGYHFISRTFWLRENVAEKKVYLKTSFDAPDQETLLYDFSLEEGDSIQMLNPITPFPEDLGYFKLDSIRMKPRLENENSRFFYFSPTESNEDGFGFLPIWVEGVGSLSLINAPGGNPDYYGVGQVSCFWKNSTLFYHDDEFESNCQSVLNIKEIMKSKIQFAVNQQKIGVLTSAEKVNRLAIYDLNGKLLKTLKSNGKSRIEINLSDLMKGIYILKVEESGRFKPIPFVLK